MTDSSRKTPSERARIAQGGAWYLEDAHALKQLLLPHGPFATLAAAQEIATEIGCGRPVFVPIGEDGSVHWDERTETREPQEMTLKNVLRGEG